VAKSSDVIVVGAGPGGLAAARGAKEAGAERVIILERDTAAGGILNQCIHDGFGLVRYSQRLTGPEYALKAEMEAEEAGAELRTGHHVVAIRPSSDGDGANCRTEFEVETVSKDGLEQIKAGTIILATGCRERTRGAIAIPGSRPAGVFTAGVIQNFVNIRNIMPGKRVVIFGSGDVGMIMARRLSLEGAEVKAVIEILPEPAGLSRNVSQCLYDYGIPIHCSHTISRIIGKQKLEAVEISPLDEDMRPVKEKAQIIECDALVLSVGLIPENEVAETAGIGLDPKTNGVITDEFMMTSVPGIFSCGNSRRIMDLADFVSEQGELAGKNAVAYLNGSEMEVWDEARSTPMAKGFPEEGTVTCTLCPLGCTVRLNDETGRYEGNKCKRGIEFAEQEKMNPKRILTSTVRCKCESGMRLLPVRTAGQVTKTSMRRIVDELGNITVKPPIKCGDIVHVTDDGDGSIINIIATANMQDNAPF